MPIMRFIGYLTNFTILVKAELPHQTKSSDSKLSLIFRLVKSSRPEFLKEFALSHGAQKVRLPWHIALSKINGIFVIEVIFQFVASLTDN